MQISLSAEAPRSQDFHIPPNDLHFNETSCGRAPAASQKRFGAGALGKLRQGDAGTSPAMGTHHGAGAWWFGPEPCEDGTGVGGVLESGGGSYTCRCVFT